MKENTNWDDSKDEILDIVDNLEQIKETEIPIKCPICNHNTAHIYMYQWGDDRGTIWAWCSNCKGCTHASRQILPDWWKNGEFINTSELTSHPIFLDEKSELIDNHLRNLLQNKNKSINTASDIFSETER